MTLSKTPNRDLAVNPGMFRRYRAQHNKMLGSYCSHALFEEQLAKTYLGFARVPGGGSRSMVRRIVFRSEMICNPKPPS